MIRTLYRPSLLRSIFVGIVLLTSFSQMHGQHNAPPASKELTVDDVLERLQDNYLKYFNTIPNIFADEHIVSNFLSRDNSDQRGGINSTIDSVFRLRRSVTEDKRPTLVESREVLFVDHRRPTDTQALPIPDKVIGAFSFAPGFLSPVLKQCYDYKLELNRRLKKMNVLIVTYSQKSSIPADAVCPLHEPNNGRAYIDPESMQIVRLEQKRSEHELTLQSVSASDKGMQSASEPATQAPPSVFGRSMSLPADSSANATGIAPGTLGTWTWSIDYAPVVINGKSFWMPKTITSSTSTNSGRQMYWSFESTYKNYHLLDVSSVIVSRDKMQPQK